MLSVLAFPRNQNKQVRSGHIVYGLYRRHPLQVVRYERVGSWFDAFLLVIEEA